MVHVIAVLVFAALCAVWMVIQLASGRPCEGTCSACKGRGQCHRDDEARKPTDPTT